MDSRRSAPPPPPGRGCHNGFSVSHYVYAQNTFVDFPHHSPISFHTRQFRSRRKHLMDYLLRIARRRGIDAPFRPRIEMVDVPTIRATKAPRQRRKPKIHVKRGKRREVWLPHTLISPLLWKRIYPLFPSSKHAYQTRRTTHTVRRALHVSRGGGIFEDFHGVAPNLEVFYVCRIQRCGW